MRNRPIEHQIRYGSRGGLAHLPHHKSSEPPTPPNKKRVGFYDEAPQNPLLYARVETQGRGKGSEAPPPPLPQLV